MVDIDKMYGADRWMPLNRKPGFRDFFGNVTEQAMVYVDPPMDEDG